VSSRSIDGSDCMTPLAQMDRLRKARLSRRGLVQAGGALGLMFATIPGAALAASHATPELLDTITVDLSGEPESIDPAIAYAPRDWSIVHSIYDSPVQFGENGEIEPLAAESLAFLDSKTIEIKLRSGITFHDGSPLTSAPISPNSSTGSAKPMSPLNHRTMWSGSTSLNIWRIWPSAV